jgi:hypothetical protein
MKNSLLRLICLLLGLATTHVSATDGETLSLQTHNLTFNTPPSFNTNTFLQLIEEYTNFTKKPATNSAEESAIASLIDRIAQASSQIEREIKNTKELHAGSFPQKANERLRNYSDSAKIALKELHKRQTLVRSFTPQTSYERIEETTQNNYSTFFSTHKLHASYHYVKNMLPEKSRLQECLLNAPLFTSC